MGRRTEQARIKSDNIQGKESVMKKLAVPLLAFAALLGVASPSWADHWHGRVGISIGVPLGYPWFYPPYYPPPYYPPVVTVPAQPPVYIEREEAPAVPPQNAYWYYCHDPEGYYPYVKECPGGWQAVSPTPPPAPAP
jgi:hypothetical protein